MIKYEIWFLIDDIEFFSGDWFYSEETAAAAAEELTANSDIYKRYFIKKIEKNT